MESLENPNSRSYSSCNKFRNRSTRNSPPVSQESTNKVPKTHTKKIPNTKIDIKCITMNRINTQETTINKRKRSNCIKCPPKVSKKNLIKVNYDICYTKRDSSYKKSIQEKSFKNKEVESEIIKLKTENKKLKKLLVERMIDVEVRNQQIQNEKKIVKEMQDRILNFSVIINKTLSDLSKSFLSKNVIENNSNSEIRNSVIDTSYLNTSLITICEFKKSEDVSDVLYPINSENLANINSRRIKEIPNEKENQNNKDIEQYKQVIKKLKNIIQTLIQENNIAKDVVCNPSLIEV